MMTLTLLFLALAFFVLYYSLVTLGLIAGLGRISYKPCSGLPPVSIIVAARNEASNIPTLLDCLLKQDYPDTEIIIVNDRSTDCTPALIQEYQDREPRVHRVDVVTPSVDMPSKKHALSLGIAASKGQILCFTDADSFPPPSWISSLVSAFDPHTGLVAGYSPYSSKANSEEVRRSISSRLLHRFIEFEEFKGATWSAASIGLGKGWLCTGRSLAYRRQVYEEVGGFEEIKSSVSGDDDLFLQLVRRHTTWGIRYVTDPMSFVPTIPPRDFRQFLHQRIRHFSAGKHFPISMKVFFFLYHLSNLGICLSFLGAFAPGQNSVLFLPYLSKCLVDSLLFVRAAPTFKQTRDAVALLPMEMLYVLYNSLIGPLGFISKFEWKPQPQS